MSRQGKAFTAAFLNQLTQGIKDRGAIGLAFEEKEMDRFDINKQDFKRPIRIYYIPVHIRDFNKRDSLSWSAIYGAYSANKILSKVSAHLAPNQFWISWPYGYYTPSVTREIRKVISKDEGVVWRKMLCYQLEIC